MGYINILLCLVVVIAEVAQGQTVQAIPMAEKTAVKADTTSVIPTSIPVTSVKPNKTTTPIPITTENPVTTYKIPIIIEVTDKAPLHPQEWYESPLYIGVAIIVSIVIVGVLIFGLMICVRMRQRMMEEGIA